MTKSTSDGEYKPDLRLEAGVHIQAAIKLFNEGILTLVESAALAKMPVESFLETLSALGINVVDQTEEALCSDLKNI